MFSGELEHLTNCSFCVCVQMSPCDSGRSIIRSSRPGDVFSLPCLTMMHLFVKHPIDSHWLHPYGGGCLLWSARSLWNNVASNERRGAKRQSGLNLHFRHVVIADTELKRSWMKVCNEVESYWLNGCYSSMWVMLHFIISWSRCQMYENHLEVGLAVCL